jgi:ribosome-binding factor A
MNSSERMKKEVMQVVGTFIREHASPASLITVTSVDIGERLKTMTIGLGVIPESQERPALSFVERHIDEVAVRIAKRLKMRAVPFLKIVIDQGAKNRQRIHDLSLEIRRENE